MKSYTVVLHTGDDISKAIRNLGLENEKNILVQAFCGTVSETYIRELQKTIRTEIPQAKLIGATTAGEIWQDKISSNTNVLTITTFENVSIESSFSSVDDSFGSREAGKRIGKELLRDESRVFILFGTGISTNGEEILEGVHESAPHVTISGGLAGDNLVFKKTLVFTENFLGTSAIVGISLNGCSLKIRTSYNFDWKKVGKPLQVTKCIGNRIYTVENRPIAEVYKEYLGLKEMTVEAGVQFPLMFERGGVDMARAVLGVNDDGSLILAGSLHNGEKVQFGFGNIRMILEKKTRIREEMKDFPAEAIFLYSCCARKMFLGDGIAQESAELSQICPSETAGFFTYGEFFSANGKNFFFNETMTALLISEDTSKMECNIIQKTITPENEENVQNEEILQIETEGFNPLRSLTHLAQKVTDELIELNNTLETEINRQTEEVRKSLEHLQELDEEKDEFISIASHEFRTPLAIIDGFTALLLQGKVGKITPEQHSILEKIQKNAKGLIQFTSDMTEIGKLKTKWDETPKNRFSATELTKEVMKDFEVACQSKDIDFTLSLPNQLDDVLDIDRDKVKRILTNLIGNACKFTEKGKIEIQIRLYSQNSSFLEFIISDTGVGISTEEQGKIFNKFYQSENYLRRKHSGIALGLSLTKGFIEKMGGELRVKSEPGKGSEFSFILPRPQ